MIIFIFEIILDFDDSANDNVRFNFLGQIKKSKFKLKNIYSEKRKREEEENYNIFF